MQKEKQNDKHLIVDTCLSGCLWWEWRWQFVSGSYWADVGLVALLQAGKPPPLEVCRTTFSGAHVPHAGAQQQDQEQSQAADDSDVLVLYQAGISHISASISSRPSISRSHCN